MSLSKQTLAHPILTLIVFALLAVMGIFTMSNVPVSLFPDVDNPVIFISTSYPNAGPEAVEKSVTKVLESSLVSVNKLKKMTSTSQEGRSSIQLEFDYGTDLDVATTNIRDKIDRVRRRLPDDADNPGIFKMDSNAWPIMRLAVRGNRSNDDLKQLAEDQIKDILEQADGVAEASVSGGRTKIVRVDLSQNRLSAYGLSISSVKAALAKQNLELGGGKIAEGKLDYAVRTTGEFTDVQQIQNTVIAKVNGYDVKLADLGTAYLGFKDKTSEVYINGVPGVYVSITKQSGENSVNVANAVYKKMEEVKATLPADVTLSIISDDTVSIRDTINTLVESAVEGLILAVIILFLFLQSFKSTIIIAISIPLSVVITLLAMNFCGITLNMMTLTGLILGVGMIVDASIVMIENIYSYRIRGTKADIAAILGSQEMIASVTSGNLTTICVFVPFIFFMGKLGFMGQMFKGIIFTVVIALVSSLFVAVFLVPVLAGKFLPLTNRNEKPVTNKVLIKIYGALNAVIEKITAFYKKWLQRALNHRAITTIVCVLLLVSSIFLAFTMRMNMMPGGNDDNVNLSFTLPIGSSLEQTTEVARQVEKLIEDEIKGYDYIITSIGTGRGNTSTYKATISIRLPSASKQIDNSNTIREKLRKHFFDFSGVNFEFGQGMSKQMTGSDIVLALRGRDLDIILKFADQLKEIMEGIPDIGEVSIDTEEGLPQIEIEIDRPRAYSMGIDVTTVASEIYNAIEGTTATTYRKDGKEYSVVLMYQPSDKTKLVDLESIYVRGSQGLVAVSNFAKLKKGLGPVAIQRENQQRLVKLSADIISKQNANVVEDLIREQIAKNILIPDSVSLSYEGSDKEMKEKGSFYGQIILMAVILVFGVMAATYESFKAPLINLATIPFIAIGVIMIYKLFGEPMSMMSMVGIIMLVGIVVNNGIILVDYTNLLMNRGIPKMQACLEAGASRLRPVLMTTLTTILGMLPMCFATEGSAGMVRPIGMAVIGGLTSSTFITLFFIPVLYSLIMSDKKKSKSLVKIEKGEK